MICRIPKHLKTAPVIWLYFLGFFMSEFSAAESLWGIIAPLADQPGLRGRRFIGCSGYYDNPVIKVAGHDGECPWELCPFCWNSHLAKKITRLVWDEAASLQNLAAGNAMVRSWPRDIRQLIDQAVDLSIDVMRYYCYVVYRMPI